MSGGRRGGQQERLRLNELEGRECGLNFLWKLVANCLVGHAQPVHRFVRCSALERKQDP